jgi:transcriptional repressor NrdR
VVIKKDGSRENFDREKIRNGLRRACEKRPVSMETIDTAVEAIEKRIQELCQKEVESRLLGELVMDELRKMDKIAYVRFASVYREFSDVSQFVDTLQSLAAPISPADTTSETARRQPIRRQTRRLYETCTLVSM